VASSGSSTVGLRRIARASARLEFHQRTEWEEETADDRALLSLVERGRNEGHLDPALPAARVPTMLWSTRYSARDQIRTAGLPKREALTPALVTLEKLIAP
jgi:hypothetical protein